MTEKEKLIELYAEVEQLRNMRIGVGECVDILIQNGVTFQKWIPVTERLPDVRGRYIVAANDGHAIRVSFADWQNRSFQWYLTGARSYWKVTHWMPLPELPKETADEVH